MSAGLAWRNSVVENYTRTIVAKLVAYLSTR